MKPLIVWQPWYDPEPPPIQEVTSEEGKFDDNIEPSPIDSLAQFSIPFVMPKIRSPFGNHAFDDSMRPTALFDCWVGWTNFEITEDIAHALELVEGVDAFRVISRYGFAIGVGKLFDFRYTRIQIDALLNSGTPDFNNNGLIKSDFLSDLNGGKETDREILELLKVRLTGSKRWAIFYNEEGFLDYIMTDDDEDPEYELKLQNFMRDTNFTVIKSDDVK